MITKIGLLFTLLELMFGNSELAFLIILVLCIYNALEIALDFALSVKKKRRKKSRKCKGARTLVRNSLENAPKRMGE